MGVCRDLRKKQEHVKGWVGKTVARITTCCLPHGCSLTQALKDGGLTAATAVQVAGVISIMLCAPMCA